MKNPRTASTLQEAAHWLTTRTGTQWDSGLVLDFVLKAMLRSILDKQARDVFLWVLPPAGTEYGFRRFDIDTASVKVTRLDPLDIAPLPLTEYESVLQLVAGGSIPLPVHPIGEPWQGEDELIIFAKEVPVVSADAVRIWARDLARLADRFESQNPAPAPPVVEAEPAATPATAPAQSPATPAPVVAASDGTTPLDKIVHSTKARRDTLTPVIEQAQKQCTAPSDTAAVWAALLVLAEKKTPPLIGATEEGLQYLKGGTAEIFKRKSLGQRLAR